MKQSIRKMTIVSLFIVAIIGSSLVLSAGEKIAETPWKIYGTVRDEADKPVANAELFVDYRFTGWVGNTEDYAAERWQGIPTKTDADGNYSIELGPFSLQSDAEKKQVRIQQGVLRIAEEVLISGARYHGDNHFYEEVGRSREGDLVLLGKEATAELVKQVEDYAAGGKEKIALVRPDEPVEINFVLKQSEKARRWSDMKMQWSGTPFFGRQGFQPSAWDFYRQIVIPNSLNDKFRESMGIVEAISASIRFDKPEIMVGEPSRCEYVVRNNGDKPLGVWVGSDYRAIGRPGSFSIQAIGEDGTIASEESRGPDMGGLGHVVKIAPKESYAFELKLHEWIQFSKPEIYSVQAARFLQIVPIEDDQEAHSLLDRQGIRMFSRAAANLLVVHTDSEKMGELIEKLGKRLRTDGSGTSDHEEALNWITHIDDERVVPYLTALVVDRKEWSGTVSRAIDALGKFDNPEAVETLKKAMSFSNEHHQGSTAGALAKGKSLEGLNFLLDNQDRLNRSARLRMVGAADNFVEKLGREKTLEMLHKRTKDQDKDVRDWAKEQLEKLGETESKKGD